MFKYFYSFSNNSNNTLSINTRIEYAMLNANNIFEIHKRTKYLYSYS